MKSCAYLFNFCVYARHSICLYLFKREKLRDSENPLQSVFCFAIAQAVNSMWYFKLSWVKFGAQNILAKIRTRLLCHGSFSLFSVNNNGVRNLTSARKLPLLNDQLQLRNQELNMSPEPIIQFYIDRKTKKNKKTTDRPNSSQTPTALRLYLQFCSSVPSWSNCSFTASTFRNLTPFSIGVQ